jgi:hypothetical protein
MNKENIILEKSFHFALKITELYNKLAAEKEFIIYQTVIAKWHEYGSKQRGIYCGTF